jgi:hypothetical protein
MPSKKSPYVTVVVKVRTARRKTTIKLSKDPVHVSVSRKQHVVWQADGGDIEIRFTRRDTPWAHGAYAFSAPWDARCTSGPARKDSIRKKAYKYTITVTNPETGECALLDPGVVIED